jgi:hypothetical protein
VLLILLLLHLIHLIVFVAELAGAVALHQRRDVLVVCTLSQLARLRREKIRVGILGILVRMLLGCCLHRILLVWQLTALLTRRVRVIPQNDLALGRRMCSKLRVILGIKLVEVVPLLLLHAAHSRRFILAPLHYLAHQLRLLRFIHVTYQRGHLRHDFLLLGHPLHICFFFRPRFLLAVARYSLLRQDLLLLGGSVRLPAKSPLARSAAGTSRFSCLGSVRLWLSTCLATAWFIGGGATSAALGTRPSLRRCHLFIHCYCFLICFSQMPC